MKQEVAQVEEKIEKMQLDSAQDTSNKTKTKLNGNSRSFEPKRLRDPGTRGKSNLTKSNFL